MATFLRWFPRIVRNQTLNDLHEAVFALRDLATQLDPDSEHPSVGDGCCGCGRWVADVVTYPPSDVGVSEAYCWRCVSRMQITRYLILSARNPLAEFNRERHNYFETHPEADLKRGDR